MFHVPEIAKVCAYQAARHYHVPYGEMLGILHTEGGGPGVIDRDANGTEDLGWAQVNTVHLPFLRRFGITRGILLKNPCINISVGAYILARAYTVEDNWWGAAEAYNAGSRDLAAGYPYAVRVFAAWHRYSGMSAHLLYTRRDTAGVPLGGSPMRVAAYSEHHFTILSPG